MRIHSPDNGKLTMPPKLFKGDNDERLLNVVFTAELVTKKLKALKPSSSPGPDNIHPRILKECALELGGPLANIFQKSMENGVLPRQWKATNIMPLFKKGKRNDPSNYRPINLVCLFVCFTADDRKEVPNPAIKA